MSRVGNKPIPLPKGVKITVGDQLLVEGPKGKQTVPVPAGITLRQENGILELQRDGEDKAALHGLTRALAANAVQGVSTGFTRELDIVGIGYRCDVKGRIATFTLGYSHPIEFYLPDGVDMKVDKQTHLVLTRIRPADSRCRWPRRCARCVRPIRTRTRACVIPASRCVRRSARPALSRKQVREKEHGTRFEKRDPAADSQTHPARVSAARRNVRGWRCSAA